MINYDSKFIKNYSQLVSLLYELLRKDMPWSWTNAREIAFRKAKESLTSSHVLMHYDLRIPAKVTCDASPTGLGAVLSHILPSGTTKPVAFASRTLTKAERGYSQLDREALGIYFGVRTFHQYLYGRKFILETDHKPLTFIFGPKHGVPQMAASRLQRWAVFLSGYDFEIKHLKGADNVPADSLSRLLASDNSDTNDNDENKHSYLNYVREGVSAIDSAEVSAETANDPILSRVLEFVMRGWPSTVDDSFLVFKSRANSLTVEDGCLMWGHRVVIPQVLRRELLSELHSVHSGVVKMKALARSFIWWPGLDSDIENVTKTCKLCLENASNPPRATLHVWKWPDGPNRRLHADFLGPLSGRMYIIIIDAFSKWVDVKELPDITVATTIKAFKEYFSTWGLPVKLVTDNGPTFTAKPFQEFMQRNAIIHVTSVSSSVEWCCGKCCT